MAVEKRLERSRAAFAAALAAAVLVLPAPARAAGFRLFSPPSPAGPFSQRSPRELDLGIGPGPDGNAAEVPAQTDAWDLDLHFPALGPSTLALPAEITVPPPPAANPKWLAVGLVTAGAIGGSFLNAYTDGNHYDWHWADEGYFGRHTYVGGGDKASHIVSYYGVARLLTSVYQAFDLAEKPSYELASATSFLAGVATEIGDGMNKYGFAYEDVVADTIGAASAWALARYQLNDLIGFRAGILPTEDVPEEFKQNGTGKDYTAEIYTADLKLAGLSRRTGRRFGPARFLLVSMTYSVKGYPYAPEDSRQRQVGLEVGLNVAEIARAAGVPESCWWGNLILTVLDIIRFPYTAIGVRYDINQHKWYGPNAGGGYSYPAP